MVLLAKGVDPGIVYFLKKHQEATLAALLLTLLFSYFIGLLMQLLWDVVTKCCKDLRRTRKSELAGDREIILYHSAESGSEAAVIIHQNSHLQAQEEKRLKANSYVRN